jgi:FKBP-type peptidyl-prolyl cis-trans isomerase
MSTMTRSSRTTLSSYRVALFATQRLTCSISRFEEITDESAQKPESKESKKRPREEEPEEPKLSKAQHKKQNKKQKAEDGKAVPTGTEKAAEVKGQPKKKEQSKKEEKPKEEKSKGKVNGEPKTLAGGLVVQDHKTGTGPAAKAGNLVRVRYVGKLQNGKIFDQNTKGEPVCSFFFPFILSCNPNAFFRVVQVQAWQGRGHQGMGPGYCRNASRW